MGSGRRIQPALDVQSFARALRAEVRGDVRVDAGTRALYATDASNYRQLPIGVVVPMDVDDVVAAVGVCRQHSAPILARGGGTSLAGQCCNEAVVIDFSRHVNRLLDLDKARRIARVEPGLVLDELRQAANRNGLTFGPDPATHNRNTLGGMIGNNSCGVHSIMAGRTADNVEELEVLTYAGQRLTVGRTPEPQLEANVSEGGRRGELYRELRRIRDRYGDLVRERFPHIPRLVSGFALDQLLPENEFNVARALVGSEGTCALVLSAAVRLVPWPSYRSLAVLGFQDAFVAADHVPEILKLRPLGLEGFDHVLLDQVEKKGISSRERAGLPDGGGWLLVEFGGGSQAEATAKAQEMLRSLGRKSGDGRSTILDDAAAMQRVWKVRESGLGATARVPGEDDTWPGWEDSAVPPASVGAYLRDLHRLLGDYGYHCALYGHFGDGCIHTRVNFDLVSAPGIAKWRRFLDQAADLVISYGGSLSGEHGDGQARGELLTKMFGPELVHAFKEFKTAWDPIGRMNPGKVVDPRPITDDLRLGAAYRPRTLPTKFKYPNDDRVFHRAVSRCVGVGLCRRTEGGTMCPSYMVTREERHSTRGRARLLFEMLNGKELRGWRDESVREALDLCLACKGCKTDCPVNVDMATYKAEFLSHYFAGRLRPRAAYSMGLIHRWARLAGIAPRLVNRLGRMPWASHALKWVAGIAPQRSLPEFAQVSLRSWFKARPASPSDRERVLLWPDTFSNYLDPSGARATVEVLEAAGFSVVLPDRQQCCGRALYDFGMLNLARRLLRRTLDELRPEIRAGTPIVCVEPSCLAVFRDELLNLFPDDLDAQRLAKQSYLLSEFLVQKAPTWNTPRVAATAIVQPHCHQRAVAGLQADEKILSQLGLDYKMLDAGCCGLAGSFGFERGEKYEVSIRAGERALLPAVRAASPETLIISDGFSCRTQIEQATGRRPLHLAEVVRSGLCPAVATHETP